MTSIFLHGRGSWASIGPSERRAVIDKRDELALLPEGVRHYSTIAYWPQQKAGVGRDPRPTRRSSPDGYSRTAKSSRPNAWLVIGRVRLSILRPISVSVYCSSGSVNGMSFLAELSSS